MPHQVTKSESTGGILQEYNFGMQGKTLTEIHAVCYKLNPASDRSAYHVTLGHLSLRNPGQNIIFPPPSWQVCGEYINWEPGSDQSKAVSVNILWNLRDGNDASKFQNYRIYVEKMSGTNENLTEKRQDQPEYIGVAHVQAYYVSKLTVPAGTASLKFIIQVFSVGGTFQPLNDSPTYQLDVKV